jgi:hypothetical protein
MESRVARQSPRDRDVGRRWTPSACVHHLVLVGNDLRRPNDQMAHDTLLAWFTTPRLQDPGGALARGKDPKNRDEPHAPRRVAARNVIGERSGTCQHRVRRRVATAWRVPRRWSPRAHLVARRIVRWRGENDTITPVAVVGLAAAHDARAGGAASTDGTNGMDVAAFTVRAMSGCVRFWARPVGANPGADRSDLRTAAAGIQPVTTRPTAISS